jgi:methanogenic corrinoid protein MtbC1
MWESGARPDISESDIAVPKRSAMRRVALSPLKQGTAFKPRLRGIIGAEVLPQLFPGNRARSSPETGLMPASVKPAKLARLLIAGCDDAFRCEINARLASGTPPLAVMMEVLAPTARELGLLWDNDDCDLIDVQRATGALKCWIRELAPQTGARTPAKPPSILLQVAPGERHSLGLDMAEAVFRGLGWRVARGEARGFLADLAEEWRDVLGFSLSCDRHIAALAEAIAEARATSRNRRLLIVVGGSIFVEQSGIAQKIGADFCASAAEMSVQLQDALLNGSHM